MVGYDWIPGLDRPQPNLSATHQWVDYERILDWSAQHNAHVLGSHVVEFGDVTENIPCNTYLRVAARSRLSCSAQVVFTAHGTSRIDHIVLNLGHRPSS
jgi:hypothetical protein